MKKAHLIGLYLLDGYKVYFIQDVFYYILNKIEIFPSNNLLLMQLHNSTIGVHYTIKYDLS